MCRKQDTYKPDTNLRISSDVGISPISAPTRSGVVSRYVFGQNKCCSRNWCIVCPLLTANNTRKNIVEVGAANILCIDHSRLNYIKSYQLQKYFMYWYFNRGGHSALTTTTAAIDVLARNFKKIQNTGNVRAVRGRQSVIAWICGICLPRFWTNSPRRYAEDFNRLDGNWVKYNARLEQYISPPYTANPTVAETPSSLHVNE